MHFEKTLMPGEIRSTEIISEILSCLTYHSLYFLVGEYFVNSPRFAEHGTECKGESQGECPVVKLQYNVHHVDF